MSTPETTNAAEPASQIPGKSPASKVSLQMRSVITILVTDEALFDLVSPCLDYTEGTIDWARISGLGLSPGHKAVIDWAYICCKDEIPEGFNPFESILNMEVNYRQAIVKALGSRWGVSK